MPTLIFQNQTYTYHLRKQNKTILLINVFLNDGTFKILMTIFLL